MSTRADPVEAEEAPVGSTDPRERTGRDRIRRAILYSLAVFAAVRVGLFVVGLLGLGLVPHTIDPVSVEGWPAPAFAPPDGLHNMFTAWERFDALWFLRIAVSGYEVGDAGAAFFPLYPLCIRAVSWLIGGHPFAAAMLVSNGSYLGALVMLYLLTASEISEAAARKTVLYISIFPTALFFFAPYSEPLFLLLTVTAFWAARRRRWPIAGIAGALAAATRSVGVLLAAALALEALHQWMTDRRAKRPTRGAPWWGILWSAVVPLGTGAYLAYWARLSGDWLAPITNQGNWQREFSLPWLTLLDGTRDAYRFLGEYPFGYHQIDWLIVVPGMLLLGYAAVRFRPAYGLYAWGSLLVPLSFVFAGRPLMSDPRFLIVLFPMFWSLAVLSERGRIPHHLIVGVSAAGLGALTILFVNWYYIF